MPEYTNFDDLLKGAQSIIDNTLKTAVADEVKKTISQTAKENVILQTPGRSSSGIDDVNSMVGEVKTTGGESVLTVKDVAKPSPSVFGQPFDEAKNAAVGGTMFASWIEAGKWVDLKALLTHRRYMGWNPAEHETWASYWNPKTARTGDSMPKVDWAYKPRREARPFIAPAQEKITANPERIIDLIKGAFED